MIRQIVIEAEPGDDSQRVFCLSINADVIARGVTAAQAYYLVGEVLRRIAFPEHAETVTFDADGGARESVRVPEAEAEALESDAPSTCCPAAFYPRRPDALAASGQ
jgi:hypothetical protein